MLKLPKIPSKRVVEQCRYTIDEFYSDDNNNSVLSFNCEVKKSEVKENFSLLKSVQDAFAPPATQGTT